MRGARWSPWSASFLSWESRRARGEPGVPVRLASRGHLRVPGLEDSYRLIGDVDRGLDAFLGEGVGDAIGSHRADAAPTEAVEAEHREDRGRLHLEVQDAGPLEIGQELLAPGLGVAAPAGPP